MTETASLVIRVDSSDAPRATRALQGFEQQAGKSERATSRFGTAVSALKIGLAAAAGVAATATAIYLRQAETYANIASRLRLATTSTAEFERAQEAVFQIAQRTSTELESVANLYGRLSQSAGELGASQSELIALTEAITQSFQISGASSQEAAGGIRQLSQALAGGVLRAEEFNSIIESSPRLVKALADGLGVGFGEVRRLVNDGAITSQILFDALSSQTEALADEFSGLPLTVGRATQQVRNSLLQLVGDVDGASGASAGLAESIQSIAEALQDPGVKDGLASLVQAAVQIAESATIGAARFGELIDRIRRGGRDVPNLALDESGLRERLAEVDEQIAAGPRNPLVIGYNIQQPDEFDLTLEQQREGLLELIGRLESRRLFAEETERLISNLDTPENVVGFSVVRPSAATISEAEALGREEDRASTRANRAAERARAQQEREAARAIEERDRATGKFNETLQTLEAQLAGPLAEAELEYQRRLAEINELAATGVVSAEDLARAQAALAEGYRIVTEEIEAQRTPAELLIEDLEFELDLVGRTNAERAAAIELRRLEGQVTEDQARAVSDLVAQLEAEAEQAAALDSFRSSFADLFSDVVSGSKSAKEAFKDFGDAIADTVTRIASQKIAEQLFGGFGSTGTGGIGGLVGSFFSLFTGGGRAIGGTAMPGSVYPVNEEGPEVATVGGRDFLLTGRQGAVVRPASQTRQRMARGGATTINVSVPGNTSRETAMQLANEAARAVRRTSRN